MPTTTDPRPKESDNLWTRDFSPKDGLKRIRGESEEEDQARYELTFSSDDEVEIFPGVRESLSHKSGSMDSEWIGSGNAPVLLHHDRHEQIGVVEKVEIRKGKGHATIRLAPSREDIRKDVEAGILRNVSVGYRIIDEELSEDEDGNELYRVNKWQPKEISLVSVPADKAVGIGRGELAVRMETRRKCHLVSDEPNKSDERTMSAETETKKVEIIDEDSRQKETAKMRADVVKEERQRQSEIHKIGARFDMADDAEKAIVDSKEPGEFAREVLEKLNKRGGGVSSEEIGLSDTEQKRFSLVRGVEALINGKRSDAEFEFEVSDALKDKMGRNSDDERLAVPSDVLLRGWVPKSERVRTLMGITTGDTSSTNIVPPDYHPEMFIEALRENSVLLNSGVRMLPGLVGDTVTIPREILDILFYWVGEDAEPTEGVYGTDQVALNYKTIAGRIPFTRRAGKTTVPNLETLLLNNIRTNLALSIERTLISSTESGTVPGGIFETTGIGSVTTGGTLSLSNLLEFEEALGTANASTSSAVGFTNTHGKKLLLETEKSTGSGNYLGRRMDDGDIMTDIGTFKISNLIPANFGGGTDKTGVLYGNPSSLIVGMWGGVELARDTATKVATGGIVLRVFQDLDMVCGRPAEWAAAVDVT